MRFDSNIGDAASLLATASGILAAACFVCLFGGCQTGQKATFASLGQARPVPPTAQGQGYTTNRLQEGDVVMLSFQYFTNYNSTQKISLDGTLNLEMVGQVQAAGKSTLELQGDLARLYKPLVKEDSPTVKLLSTVASVYVGGAVNRPGKLAMERPMTPLEAIMEAGGFDPSRARLSDVTVLRVEHGKQITFHLNLKRVLQGGDPAPFYLKPFDIIHVPSKTFNF
jgi:polysaccharide export outer membrane protein